MSKEAILNIIKNDINRLKEFIEEFGVYHPSVAYQKGHLKGYIYGLFHAEIISNSEWEEYLDTIKRIFDTKTN